MKNIFSEGKILESRADPSDQSLLEVEVWDVCVSDGPQTSWGRYVVLFEIVKCFFLFLAKTWVASISASR